MKITIAYTEQEQDKAASILHLVQNLMQGSTHRYVDQHKPYKHIYIKDKQSGS